MCKKQYNSQWTQTNTLLLNGNETAIETHFLYQIDKDHKNGNTQHWHRLGKWVFLHTPERCETWNELDGGHIYNFQKQNLLFWPL